MYVRGIEQRGFECPPVIQAGDLLDRWWPGCFSQEHCFGVAVEGQQVFETGKAQTLGCCEGLQNLVSLLPIQKAAIARINIVVKREPQVDRRGDTGFLEAGQGVISQAQERFFPVRLLPRIPGAERCQQAVRQPVIGNQRAGFINRKLPLSQADMLLMKSNEARYLSIQLAGSQKVKRDIQITAPPLYLLLHILQAKTHKLLLHYIISSLYCYSFSRALIIQEKLLWCIEMQTSPCKNGRSARISFSQN